MSKKTEFSLEMRKLRRRHIPLLFLMVFALITAWTYSVSYTHLVRYMINHYVEIASLDFKKKRKHRFVV